MKKEKIIYTELFDDNGWVEGSKTGNSFPDDSKEVLVDDNGYLGLPSINPKHRV